jgi:hypothetical protein
MPALTTECIFIRDLFLHFGESHSEFVQQQKTVSGSGGVSYGPFHLGGRHSNSSDERQAQASWDAQGIKVPGLQLLGFMCHMLPKAPSPHPDITSWI